MPTIAVIGAGYAGLITAHTLLRDDWDVEIITRDGTAGGVWAPERVYPDLNINNVYGEYHFSCMPMELPANFKSTGGRLSGDDMQKYAQKFAARFLDGRIRYKTEVTRIRRNNEGWSLDILDLNTKIAATWSYHKVVLCTGGASHPSYPPLLSPNSALQAGFSGIVVHSSEFRSRLQDILAATQHSMSKVVVIGGGKSAQDLARYLAKQGRKVVMVFDKIDAFIATPFPLPNFIRKSRIVGLLSPHTTLRTRLERFLHTTKVGAAIVHGVFSLATKLSYYSVAVPKTSPLRNAHSVFWGIRSNDEGSARPDSFFALVNAGKIELIAPTHAKAFAPDGRGIILENGSEVSGDVVVLATGYTSSWDDVLEDVREELGMERALYRGDEFQEMWNYTSLMNPPVGARADEQWTSAIYRGLVPAKNILNRDFAINGAVFTINNGYAYEICAHWISSYFLRDSFLRLPTSVEEALRLSYMKAAWLRKRYPLMLSWVNESYSSDLAILNWPQQTDDLLQDMSLPIHRSGGNWITWPFKPVDITQIENLREERRQLRATQPA